MEPILIILILLGVLVLFLAVLAILMPYFVYRISKNVSSIDNNVKYIDKKLITLIKRLSGMSGFDHDPLEPPKKSDKKQDRGLVSEHEDGTQIYRID